MMKNVVFLASGNGGNLNFLHGALGLVSGSNARISGVVADRECGALKSARRLGVPALRVSYDGQNSAELISGVRSFAPDIVVTNIHRILDGAFLSAGFGQLINLHYSLLPSFGGCIGTAPVKLALAKGCKFIGTTVHFVSAEVDEGPIISQSVINVRENEPFEDLMNRVFRSGCINLFSAVRTLAGAEVGSPKDSSRALFSNPGVNIDWFSEQFWLALSN